MTREPYNGRDKVPSSTATAQHCLSTQTAYFVTCCTYRRRPHLPSDDVHRSFIKFAQRAQINFGIAVGLYVVPDHLHFLVALPDDVKLGVWIGTLKRVLARAVEAAGSSDPIWQRGFF